MPGPVSKGRIVRSLTIRADLWERCVLRAAQDRTHFSRIAERALEAFLDPEGLITIDEKGIVHGDHHGFFKPTAPAPDRTGGEKDG